MVDLIKSGGDNLTLTVLSVTPKVLNTFAINIIIIIDLLKDQETNAMSLAINVIAKVIMLPNVELG